jgi:hypothetical protein
MKRSLLPCAFALLLVAAGSAHASDAVKAAVTPLTGPEAIVTENGTGLSAGTYAVGTIQIDYTYVGTVFPTGDFATFRLDLQNLRVSSKGQFPDYPVTLNLDSLGSPNVTLTPAAASFSVGAPPWTGSTIVTVGIPGGVALDPTLNQDGSVIVGNLALDAHGTHLDTATNIQVKIRLVHPTNCVAMYTFVTDTDLVNVASSITVKLGGPAANRKIVATSPYAQLSHDVLLVNTCGTDQTIDLRLSLDSRFETNPSSNPGNAVSLYSTSGAVSSAPINLASFGSGTGYGQTLQFTDLTLPAGTTTLVTVHMQINKSLAPASLGSSPFTFSASAFEPASGFATLASFVTNNPATASVSFTIE